MMSLNSRRPSEFENLYAEHFERISRYCVRCCDNAEEADDVVAQTFTVAWRRRGEFLNADSPLAWLYGVAKNNMNNSARSTFRRRRLLATLANQVSSPQSDDPEKLTILREELRRVEVVMRSLRIDDRQLVVLVVYHQWTYSQVAAATGVAPERLRKRMYRIRKLIQSG